MKMCTWPWMWICGWRGVQTASVWCTGVQRGALSSDVKLKLKTDHPFDQRSTCHNHKVVNAVNTHQNTLESTGIGACACARHFVPHSMVDFQMGERYVKIKGATDPLSIFHKADQYGLFHLQCLEYHTEPWTSPWSSMMWPASGLLTFTSVCKTVTS